MPWALEAAPAHPERALPALQQHVGEPGHWPSASPESPEGPSLPPGEPVRPPEVGLLVQGVHTVLIKARSDPLLEEQGQSCVCNGPSQEPGNDGPSTEVTGVGLRSGRGLVPDNQAGRSLISVHK